MHLHERNKGPMVVVVDDSSISFLFDSGGQFMDDRKRMGGNEIVIEQARERPANNNIVVEDLNEEQCPLGKW